MGCGTTTASRNHIIMSNTILVPRALFVSLSQRGLGTRNEETKGSRVKRFPVLDSGLPVFMYAVLRFQYTVWESHSVLHFRSRFLCFKHPSKKKRAEPFVSRLREAKSAMGTRMVQYLI